MLQGVGGYAVVYVGKGLKRLGTHPTGRPPSLQKEVKRIILHTVRSLEQLRAAVWKVAFDQYYCAVFEFFLADAVYIDRGLPVANVAGRDQGNEIGNIRRSVHGIRYLGAGMGAGAQPQ